MGQRACALSRVFGNLERLQILDLLHNEMTVEEQDMLQASFPTSNSICPNRATVI